MEKAVGKYSTKKKWQVSHNEEKKLGRLSCGIKNINSDIVALNFLYRSLDIVYPISKA